jgi:hypothetical protein
MFFVGRASGEFEQQKRDNRRRQIYHGFQASDSKPTEPVSK